MYDTSGYDIGGFGKQQSGDASLTFTSPRGIVRVDRLPRVTSAKPAQEARGSEGTQSAPTPAGGDTGSIVALIGQLGQLKEKGLLTEQEFAAKKGELLKRL